MVSQLMQVQPVCLAVGGRAGVGRSTLVDALVGRMSGLGPLTIGELPASNDPARRTSLPGAEVPIDIAIHMVLRGVQDSDRRAIRGHRSRGIPVLGVLARADSIPDCWAVAGRCEDLPLLPVGLAGRGNGEPAWVGIAELVDCLAQGVGEILAGRADRQLAEVDRRAVEGGIDGGDRDLCERMLAGPEARRLRMIGAPNWDRSAGSADRALEAAARWRALANSARDPAEAARASNWHRRHVARAVELGARPMRAGQPSAGHAADGGR